MDISNKIAETCNFLSSKTNHKPSIALVLGSGFGDLSLKDSVQFKFNDIPHFRVTGVEGHTGILEFGYLEQKSVLVLRGRLHLYEGYSADEVVYPVRVMAKFGIQNLILTNASGGINENVNRGDLVVITDHINLTGTSPLVGKKNKFLDLTNAYDPELRKKIKAIFKNVGIKYNEGIYCGLLGPNYETPAEIKFLKTIGADMVGMSTVLECIAAREAGLKVLGLSCISNLVPSTKLLTHEDVCAETKASFKNFDKLIREFINL